MPRPLTTEMLGIPQESLATDDVIVVVMGPTGSGKSSFIEKATGATGMAGHGLESCTKEISVIKLEYPGVNLCFVDTPGFDNTCKSDVDILKLIENGLSTTKQFRLAGLLYLHRISDNRVAGSSLKYFRLFQQLCGDDFSNIVLTTTMWGEDEQVRAAHEEELMSDFWRPMIACGSSVKRFLYTRESAFEILSPFFAEVQRRSVRHLRNNLQHCRLLQNSPSAAEASQVKLRELVLLHENILGRIQGEPGETSDPHQLRLLMNDYRTASVRLQRAAKFSKGNRIPVRLSSIFLCYRKARSVDERGTRIEKTREEQERALLA